MFSYDRLKRMVGTYLRERGSNDAPEGDLMQHLATGTGIAEAVTRAALARMQNENLVLLADGSVFLIA